MLTYWVKWDDGGWVVTLAANRLLGPTPNRKSAEIAACELAMNQVDTMVSTRVMVRDADGREHPVAQFGPKTRGPRPV